MLLAVDSHYWETADGASGDEPSGDAARARVAGILFSNWQDSEPVRTQVVEISHAEPYQPGSFYLRELPGILTLINRLDETPEVVIIDAYVWLTGFGPGLGAHLWDALDRQAAVVGVAKSGFRGAPAVTVHRRDTQRPLYVSSAGVSAEDAARDIIFMYGNHRLPSLLKLADDLARRGEGGRRHAGNENDEGV